MASASDHRAHSALQPADCLILLPQRLPAAVETSIGPAHYPAECTQSDAFLQPSLRARKGRANSNSFLIRYSNSFTYPLRAADADVPAAAARESRVLLTFDKDFGEFAARSAFPPRLRGLCSFVFRHQLRSGGTASCCSDRGARRLERSFLGRRHHVHSAHRRILPLIQPFTRTPYHAR